MSLDDHEAIPDPSTFDPVMGDGHNADAVAFLVDVPTKPSKAVRINIMLPEDLLQEIDRVTTNRSRFLAKAARAKLFNLLQH